jgi:glutamyl/glutaminyl-tRNA synthetase
LAKYFFNTDDQSVKSDVFLRGVVNLAQERMKKLSDVAEMSEFLFSSELDYRSELLVWKKSTASETKVNLEKVYELLEKVPEREWVRHAIKDEITTYLSAKNLKVGDYLWPLRVALTGKEASPGPFEVAEVLGKGKSLDRIKKAVELL